MKNRLEVSSVRWASLLFGLFSVVVALVGAPIVDALIFWGISAGLWMLAMSMEDPTE